MSAVKFFGENHLQLNHVVSARIANGVQDLPAIKGYTHALVLMWRPHSTYTRFVEMDGRNGQIDRLRIKAENNDWSQLRILQILMTDDVSATVDLGRGQRADPETNDSEAGRLSTIQEGSAETDSVQESLDSFLYHQDPRLKEYLVSAIDDLSTPLGSATEPEEHNDAVDRMPLSLMQAQSHLRVEPPSLATKLDDHAEFIVMQPMTNAMPLERPLHHDEVVLLQMAQNSVRQTVVKRDDDLLTPAQIKEHWPEVRAAMLK